MQYEQLQLQYGLPSQEELLRYFEFELEDGKPALRVIRRSMCERVEKFINVLDSLFHTDSSSPSSMHEMQNLSRQDHAKALRVYRRLMYFFRYGQHVAVTLEEAEEAKFIQEVFSKWQKTVQEVGYLLNQLKLLWLTQKTTEEEVAYLG